MRSNDDPKTALEAAIALIEYYVLRGDSEESLRAGCMGCYCGSWSACISGFMNGKKYPSTKILVEKVDDKIVNEVFSLPAIIAIIRSGKKQLTLF